MSAWQKVKNDHYVVLAQGLRTCFQMTLSDVMLADMDTTLTPQLFCVRVTTRLFGGPVVVAVIFLTFCFKSFGSVIVYLPLV